MPTKPAPTTVIPTSAAPTVEHRRLAEDAARTQNWKRWGPYLSERQWATVREDYSEGGTCWDYFPHDHARSRSYRWGEDGLLGITDRECRLCFGLALWNGKDPILKERIYGLTGSEGNHGEDPKELYYYLDSTPTHSWMRGLYKYPQAEFPYRWLLDENRRRGIGGPEFELTDTGVFNEGRYFDVFAEYAKTSPEHILIRIRVANRGPEAATIHVLPQLWYRNLWSWGVENDHVKEKPTMFTRDNAILLQHETLGSGEFRYTHASDGTEPTPLFTENESNIQRLWGVDNASPYVKDAFHRHVVNGEQGAVNPARTGTKAALHYVLTIPAGAERTIDLQLAVTKKPATIAFGGAFEAEFARAQREADEFYARVIPAATTPDERNVIRQGYAGLLWSKQFYYYVMQEWFEGDPASPKPPASRKRGRNKDWGHLHSRDIISMPDKWEYPWFAAWDLAFHMIPFARIDPDFAKSQLILFLREWYMHPNGQIPAYEFNFGDVNPPVHAWAAWRVYKISGARGHRDRGFLESVFQKLLMNFTWWVNRKDAEGKNLFSGGFLGLDNIGVFDRGQPIPGGGSLNQADGTAWMAFYANSMLSMALELALEKDGTVNVAYEDMASKFFEHFVQIVDAINFAGGTGLWNAEDGFYYDQISYGTHSEPLRIRSLVGLLPMIAVELLDQDLINKLPGFKKRYQWFLHHRPELARNIRSAAADPTRGHHKTILAIPSRKQLTKIMEKLMDETEFLSDYGIRGVSKFHEKNPFIFRADGTELRLDYAPAESNTYLFGGNSNWRGPIWFPVNFLIVEALERYGEYYRDTLLVEVPKGSGKMVTLQQAALEIQTRLGAIFLAKKDGRRPVHGDCDLYAQDQHFKELVLFYEYFHGDSGRGVGATHQTGWTALSVGCLSDSAKRRASPA